MKEVQATLETAGSTVLIGRNVPVTATDARLGMRPISKNWLRSVNGTPSNPRTAAFRVCPMPESLLFKALTEKYSR
jgi:hypothetical protein